MGCYGIGVGRLAASVCEASHDDYGPIWPVTIAPWQVHLCCMRVDDPDCKAEADRIYDELLKQGVEVIYDDRNVRAGAMFADADLLGCPVRIMVGPKNLREGKIEMATRDKSVQMLVDKTDIIDETKKLIGQLFDEINSRVRPLK